MTDDKIINLPSKPKPAKDNTLTVVHNYGGCQHRHVEVDEKLDEVTCRDCNAKLNPIWVLRMLAFEDDRLRDRWAGMRAEIRALGGRVRFKCQRCGEWNRLMPRASSEDLRESAERIKREESL